MKWASPSRQSISRFLVRYEATAIRTRLCIQPSASSWRIPASIQGTPVSPCFQASSDSGSSRQRIPRKRSSYSSFRFSGKARITFSQKSRQASWRRSAAAPSVPLLERAAPRARGPRPCRSGAAGRGGWSRRRRGGRGRARSRRPFSTAARISVARGLLAGARRRRRSASPARRRPRSASLGGRPTPIPGGSRACAAVGASVAAAPPSPRPSQKGVKTR